MSQFETVTRSLQERPKRWLVTGAAGFIGSNLVEQLLVLGQDVVGLDNFATGHRRNVDELHAVAAEKDGTFAFVEADILDRKALDSAMAGADYVLHQAALGSVPRSIADPITTNAANVTGFLHALVAARDAGVRRFVYAASSSTYGDHPGLPKVEDRTGKPLSPYAVTKLVNELYADVFQKTYGIESIGLRYFNVFGRRQDPRGAYAAVIPRWIANLLEGRTCEINGDGATSRDFCYIDNVVQANILAATAPTEASGEVYNVAYGERTTLTELFSMIRDGLAETIERLTDAAPVYRDFRPGDVRHSLADITKARTRLGYEPTWSARDGLRAALAWYVADHQRTSTAA